MLYGVAPVQKRVWVVQKGALDALNKGSGAIGECEVKLSPSRGPLQKSKSFVPLEKFADDFL